MLSSYQRSFIIKQLRSKYSYWKNPETKFLFFKGLPTNSQIPAFAIERDNNGYFYLSDELIAYCDLRNGYVCRMRKNWRAKDWECYKELYTIGQQTGRFRIDIPKHREEFTVDGSRWEYAELQSPNNDYGQNYNDDVFQWPELIDGYYPNEGIDDNCRDSVSQYFKDLIDQTAMVLYHASLIADKHNVGLPGTLCRPSTRFKDAQGYFWSDFDQNMWVERKNEVVQYALIILQGSLQFAKACGVLDDTRIEDCTNYAREKWTTI
jgi:hypothetical protein